MRRYLTLVFLLFLAIPAGITFSGCTRNPAANYCNGLGYGTKITDVQTIDLEPKTTGVSIAFGQTRQINAPTAKTCKGENASVTGGYTYGTTNNQLIDISPSGGMCAGTWNRNSGGGIADYTICNIPKPLPNTGGLPYATAYITASASSVTSNPVQVFVHAQVSSIALALSNQSKCYSQGASAQLDSEACFASNGQQYELCAPAAVTKYSCPGGLPPGVSSVPSCSTAVGTLSYNIGTSSIANLNSTTNVITAQQPGTTAISASVAGSGSSAGYFTTCPPESISVTLNGGTDATVTQGVQQNIMTTVTDTNGQVITGLTLDYQSTNPIDISVGSTGAVSPSFPGAASVYAICQPGTCNPAPINKVGLFGTGLPITSNNVTITTPGTVSSYVWFGAPGQSQYFVPVDLLNGTTGSTVRLPYVPNSMVMDQTATNLYFGSSHALMEYSTSNNSSSRSPDTSVPGVVLAVSPDNHTLVINDPVRKVFYLYAVSSASITATFSGVGNSAKWTPDSKTLYISDSASLGPNHSNTLYVYNVNTGWTTYDLTSSGGATNVALTIPSVGAYLSGDTTVAHTWCPQGNAADYASLVFYPEGDSVAAKTDVLAATNNGKHILGAALAGGGIQLSDIGVTIPSITVVPPNTGTPVQAPIQCPANGNSLQALTLSHTLNQLPVSGVSATQVNQVVASAASNLAFITYNGTTPGAPLPYYLPGSNGAAGTLNYVSLVGNASITAPLTGTFSPDDKLFFVSTAGDNLVHFINVSTLTDVKQINPNLPACAPGSDPDCKNTVPSNTTVPATVIAVKPRTTT
jgi:trimeric autotransporter adhesin